MSRTTFIASNVPALASYLDRNWRRVSRDMHGLDHVLRRFSTARHVGSISRARLWRIGYVKSTRKSELLKSNDSIEVRNVTAEAFRVGDERRRIELLCSLQGVSVPRASAVLSWTHPDIWPVIDQRAWRTLRRFDVVTCYNKGTGLGPIQWAAFVKAIAALQGALKDKELTPQQIDRVLYQDDKDRQQGKA